MNLADVLLERWVSGMAGSERTTEFPAQSTPGTLPDVAHYQSAVVGLIGATDPTPWATAVEQFGGRWVATTTPATFLAALDRDFPRLALLDLTVAGDWGLAIQRSKLRPHTRAIPLYAFTPDAGDARLLQAQQIGINKTFSKAALVQAWPGLLQQALHPPIRYPAGWDAPLSAAARAGLQAFNQGDYFEQHEHFEHAWLAEPRPIRDLYQGILQIGVAFYQIERGNWAGALKMFRRGLPKLRDLLPVCQGIRLGRFRAAAEQIHNEISHLGPERMDEFDQARFPQIELANPKSRT